MVPDSLERKLNAHSVASVDRGSLLPLPSPGRPKSGDEGGHPVRMVIELSVSSSWNGPSLLKR